MLAVESLFLAGLGVGLASVAGVRAFVPLALAVLFSHLGWFGLPEDVWPLVIGLAVLAVLEITLDKIRALERGFNYAMVPVRAVSGASLFAAALGLELDTGSLPWLAAGAAIAGVVAVAKVLLRPSAKAASAGVSTAFLSIFEDIVALAGGVVGFFVPLVPVLLVAFLLFFFYRVRRRRERKYGGLRILGD